MLCCAKHQHVSNDVLTSTASMSAVLTVERGGNHTTPHHTTTTSGQLHDKAFGAK